MPALDPGTLNRRITIQTQATTQDEFGQPTKTWTDFRSCWASIRTASSREVYAAAGFVSQLSHVISIRYNASALVTAGMRVTYGSSKYRVQAASDPDAKHEVQQLLCLEETDA